MTVLGRPLRRREDPRLLTGHGRFTDDIHVPGMLYGLVVRSSRAHARIVDVDVSRALAAPGVVAVFTGRDLAGKLGPVPTAWLPPDSDIKTPAHPVLAEERVRYVGDGVAFVVAEDPYAARDAADLVHVSYEPLAAVTDPEAALRPEAPLVHADVAQNIAFHWRAGKVSEETLARAEVVVRHTFRQQRLIPNAMEPRAALAQFDPLTGELTLWLTSQNPHIHRFLLSGILGIPEHRLRVIAPDVGGGFGSKIACYPDEALVAYAARELGRPVKWTEERREGFVATTHGRDMVIEVTLAGETDGTMRALKVRALANMGAYLSTAAPGVPTILFGLILPGPYRIPEAEVDVTGVFTHTTPVDAYRGAGRPEATYVLERMVDLFADRIGKDPVAVRRQNLIQRHEFPYKNAFGLTYDSGDYEGALDKALALVGYEDLRRRQAELRQEGQYLGIGVTTYVEICGLGPSQVAGAVGFQGGLWESADVRIHPSGKVTAFSGGSPHGQGEDTTFAQIVAEALGVPVEDVDVVHGDTRQVAMGWGTYGSRTTAVGGSALALACERLVAKGKKIAAHLLEVAEADVRFAAGRYVVAGVPDRSISIQEVSLRAHLAWDLPADVEPGMEAQASYDPTNFVYPFGTHVAVVQVDAATGAVTLGRYVAVDDCGRVINPLVVRGQVEGGVVQGIGQALWEGAAYDEQGQLVTATLLDYALPRAASVPPIETAYQETPSPTNPLGVKGIGETGTIAATPTVVNAVLDALRPFGIQDLRMPLTPETVWNAIRGGGGS
jgi:carbon-monoxide dehydrogenase large subunit